MSLLAIALLLTSVSGRIWEEEEKIPNARIRMEFYREGDWDYVGRGTVSTEYSRYTIKWILCLVPTIEFDSIFIVRCNFSSEDVCNYTSEFALYAGYGTEKWQTKEHTCYSSFVNVIEKDIYYLFNKLDENYMGLLYNSFPKRETFGCIIQ
jgi:hypothetical protein